MFVEAYRSIGAPEAAALLEAAVAFFPFPDPHLHAEKREEFMAQASGEEGYFSPECDAIYDMDIWGKIEQYIAAHPAEFSGTVN